MQNNDQSTHKDKVSSNYDLSSEAVETLANAGKGDAPQYSREELDRYKSKKGIKIPDPVKIIFVKTWFSGAICFFFLWGLGNYIGSIVDMLFILAVVLGVATDLLVNNTIRFMEKYPDQNRPWMMFPKKSMVSFVLNIVYSGLIIYCVYTLYTTINLLINTINGVTGAVTLGVEPILFGVFCTVVDLACLGIKRVFVSILEDAKESARRATQPRDETST
jgi:hypothetical protein